MSSPPTAQTPAFSGAHASVKQRAMIFEHAVDSFEKLLGQVVFFLLVT